MQILINRLRGALIAEGKRASMQTIADATGIDRNRLTKMANGQVKEIRLDYIDALCAFFGVTAGEVVQADPVALPLRLNLRPDRAGHKVGDKTKKRRRVRKPKEDQP